jgi:hypothetical protein
MTNVRPRASSAARREQFSLNITSSTDKVFSMDPLDQSFVTLCDQSIKSARATEVRMKALSKSAQHSMDSMLELMNSSFPTLVTVPSRHRGKRAPFGFMGDFYGAMFGVATEKDLREVQQVAKMNAELASGVTKNFVAMEKEMSSLANLTVKGFEEVDKKFSNVHKQLQGNVDHLAERVGQQIRKWQLQTMFRDLLAVRDAQCQDLYDSYEIVINAYNHHLQVIVMGIQSALAGRLHPAMVDEDTLKATLQDVSHSLVSGGSGFVPRYSTAELWNYYEQPLVDAFRAGPRLIIRLRIPLSEHAGLYTVLQPVTYPVALDPTSKQYTKFDFGSSMIAVSEDNSRYFELSQAEWSNCWGGMIRSCGRMFATTSILKPTCLSHLATLPSIPGLDLNCPINILMDAPPAQLVHMSYSNWAVIAATYRPVVRCQDKTVMESHECATCKFTLQCGCKLILGPLETPTAVDGCTNLTSSSKAIPNAAALLEWNGYTMLDTINPSIEVPALNIPKISIWTSNKSYSLDQELSVQTNLREFARQSAVRSKVYQKQSDVIEGRIGDALQKMTGGGWMDSMDSPVFIKWAVWVLIVLQVGHYAAVGFYIMNHMPGAIAYEDVFKASDQVAPSINVVLPGNDMMTILGFAMGTVVFIWTLITILIFVKNWIAGRTRHHEMYQGKFLDVYAGKLSQVDRTCPSVTIRVKANIHWQSHSTSTDLRIRLVQLHEMFNHVGIAGVGWPVVSSSEFYQASKRLVLKIIWSDIRMTTPESPAFHTLPSEYEFGAAALQAVFGDRVKMVHKIEISEIRLMAVRHGLSGDILTSRSFSMPPRYEELDDEPLVHHARPTERPSYRYDARMEDGLLSAE